PAAVGPAAVAARRRARWTSAPPRPGSRRRRLVRISWHPPLQRPRMPAPRVMRLSTPENPLCAGAGRSDYAGAHPRTPHRARVVRVARPDRDDRGGCGLAQRISLIAAQQLLGAGSPRNRASTHTSAAGRPSTAAVRWSGTATVSACTLVPAAHQRRLVLTM